MLLLDEFGHDASVLCLDYDMSGRANGKKRENGGAAVIVAMNDEEVRGFINFEVIKFSVSCMFDDLSWMFTVWPFKNGDNTIEFNVERPHQLWYVYPRDWTRVNLQISRKISIHIWTPGNPFLYPRKTWRWWFTLNTVQKLLNGGDCGEVKKAAAKEEWAEIRFEATERPRVEMEGFTASWEGEKKEEDEKAEVR